MHAGRVAMEAISESECCELLHCFRTSPPYFFRTPQVAANPWFFARFGIRCFSTAPDAFTVTAVRMVWGTGDCPSRSRNMTCRGTQDSGRGTNVLVRALLHGPPRFVCIPCLMFVCGGVQKRKNCVQVHIYYRSRFVLNSPPPPSPPVKKTAQDGGGLVQIWHRLAAPRLGRMR